MWRWFFRTQLAFNMLRREKARLFVALVGIIFADLLIFMQLGFKGALFLSCGTLHRSFKGDLCLVHPYYQTLIVPQTISRDYLNRCLANDKVAANQNKIAIQRGPIVYCAEWPDFQEGHVLNLVVNPTTSFTTNYRPNFLDGVTVISGEAQQAKRTLENQINLSNVKFEAIPYYAWANRGSGEMAVWFGTKPSAARPLPAPTIASRSKLTASHKTKTLLALNDQAEPKNSNDHDNIYYHWWPMKDTLQWVQYTFEQPATVSSTKVYWFDDGPWGGCRVPASWQLLYQTPNGDWKPVQSKGTFGIAKDRYNELTFDPVEGPKNTATATFHRPGLTKVWVEVFEKKGQVLVTLAQADQIEDGVGFFPQKPRHRCVTRADRENPRDRPGAMACSGDR